MPPSAAAATDVPAHHDRALARLSRRHSSSLVLPPTWQVVQEYGALGSHLDATQLVCRAPLPPLQQGQLPGEMTFLWSERAQRKGMSPVILDAGPLAVEQPRFRYWGWDAYDISWWIGIWYMVGALCWITNATFAGWPSDDLVFNTYLLGATSVTGALLFQLGAMCQYWEALNMERAPVFGYHVDLLQRKLVARIVSRHMCLCGPATYTIKAARGKSLLFDPSPHGSVSSGAAHAATPKAAGEQQAHQRRDGGSSHTLRSGSLLTRQCSSAGVPHGVYEYPCIERLFDDDAGSTVTGAHLAAPAAQHMPPAAAAAGAAANGGLKQLSVVLPEPCKDYASVAFADQRGGGGAASPGGASPGGASSVMSAFSLDRLPSFVSSHGKWVWWGFRLRELGFLAAFVQVTGTTIFLAACVMGFPGVLPVDFEAGDWKVWDACFWAPFLFGSCLFIASALLFMLEVQTDWWRPAPRKLSWWLALANVAGSIGFWLCSFFGLWAYPAQKYQRWGMAFSCLWGSCFFLISGYLQLLEALNKYQRPALGGAAVAAYRALPQQRQGDEEAG